MQGSWNLSALRSSMLALVVTATGLAAVSAALGQTPTAAQAEMFRNLDPAQQQQILEAMETTGWSVRYDPL